MSPIIGSTLSDVPVSGPTAFLPDEEFVTPSLRPQGRLPQRSALQCPSEPGKPPAVSDIYWWR